MAAYGGHIAADPTRLHETIDVVGQILDGLGHGRPSPDAVLVGDGGALLTDQGYGGFIGAFSMQTGCMPYALADSTGLTIEQFCQRYVDESFPPPPTSPMADTAVDRAGPGPARQPGEVQHGPLGFVLGCGRSGTTLFRAMLDRHDGLWAPGELHLAQFDTMAERAVGAGPFLRTMLVPDVAARLGETREQTGERLAGWERDGVPVTEVYRTLHDADPRRLIVDKTPSYSEWPEHLTWIVHHFPEARFVHLVRDPSDVIRSLVRMQLTKQASHRFPDGTSPYHVAEAIWIRHNEHIEQVLATVDPDRQVRVRYEDLVADPAAVLAGVCDLLGVDHDPAMADPYAGRTGPVAAGAGDPGVNRRTGVEARPPGGAFYPLSLRCRALATGYGY